MSTELPKPAAGRTPGMAFIFITMLLDVIGFGLVIPVAPALVKGLLHGDTTYASLAFGVTVALYTTAQFLCAPLLGALSDRYGRKPVLLLALLASTLGYLVNAMTPNIAWLLVSRVLGGIGGASISVASTYIADVSPPEKRAQNFGLSGMAFGLGFIMGPALGGLLGGYGERVPFYVAAVISFLNFLYGLLLVPESHTLENRAPFRWASANPLAWLELLRKYPFVVALGGSLLWYGLANQCLQSNWVVFTTYRFNWTTTENGLSLTAVGLSVAIVQGGLIRLVLPRLGERRAIAFGLAVNTVAMLLYGFATQSWMMYAILISSAIGGVAGPAVQAQISKEIPAQEQGRVQGAIQSLMSLTGIAGPLVANGAFAYFTGPAAPVKVPGVAFFLGALCSLFALLGTMRVFSRFPAKEATTEAAGGGAS